MKAPLVVKHDPVFDVAAGRSAVRPAFDANLGLDRGEEGFGGGAVEAGPRAAGALADVQPSERVPVGLRGSIAEA